MQTYGQAWNQGRQPQNQLPQQEELFRRQQGQGFPREQRSDSGPHHYQPYGHDRSSRPYLHGPTDGYSAPGTPNGPQQNVHIEGYTPEFLRNDFCGRKSSHAHGRPAGRAPPPQYQGSQGASGSRQFPGGGLFLPPQQTDHRRVNSQYKSPLPATSQHGPRPGQPRYSYSGPGAASYYTSASSQSYNGNQPSDFPPPPPPPSAPYPEPSPEPSPEPQPSTSKTVIGALKVGGILLPDPVAAKKSRVSLDLTADEDDLTNAPPQHSRAFDHTNGSEMPSSFTPLDPEAEGYPGKKFKMPGINPLGGGGFYDDVPKSGQSTSSRRPARGGRSGANQPGYSFQNRQPQNAPTKRNAGVVDQFAEPSPGELAGQRALQRQQAQVQTAKKGGSKASKRLKEIFIDSDEDERRGSAVHPHEDENDRIENDDNGPSSYHPVASTSKHTQRNAARLSVPYGADEPSSPDPIGIAPQRDEAHRNKKSTSSLGSASYAADTVVKNAQKTKIVVKDLIQKFEPDSKSGGKQNIATSLRKKGESSAMALKRSDGGPTDDGELPPVFSDAKGKIPRASLAVKGTASNRLHVIECRGIVLGDECLVNDPERDCSVVVNANGTKAVRELTLRIGDVGYSSEPEPAIRGADVCESAYYRPPDGDHPEPYVCIGFSQQGRKKYDAILNLVSEPTSNPPRSLLIYLKNAPTVDWASHPTSDEDYLLTVLNGFKRIEQDSKKKAETRNHILAQLKEESLRDHPLSSGKKTKKKAKQPDPKQPRLSFGPVSPHQSESRQALTKLAREPRRRSESQEYEGVRASSAPQANGTRRSSRPSTSSLAGPHRAPVEAMQVEAAVPVLTKEEQEYEYWLKRCDAKYKPDEVVAEFPPGQPGAITLPWSDIKRLRPDEFLNDTLIEFGLKQIMHRIEAADANRSADEKIAPKVHIFNSFFYKQLSTTKKKGTDPYKLVEKWTKKVDLFAKRYIIVPINEHFHWYLAMIINPHALLRPPLPPVAPEPPRQSARTKRAAPAFGAQDESQDIVTSSHFRLPKALRDERKLGLGDVPRDSDTLTSASDGEETPSAEAEEADDSAETGRCITEQLQAKGDTEAASQNIRELRLDDSPEPDAPDAGGSQVRNDEMQVDAAAERVAAEVLIDEGDDEDMIVEDARGTLEGGGSRRIDQSPSPSRRHTRWKDDDAVEPSDPVLQGSPELEIVTEQSAELRNRASPALSVPPASQEKQRLLQEELFPKNSSADGAVPGAGDGEAEPAVVLSSGTIKGDEDDEIEVIASAARAGPARVRSKDGQSQSEVSKPRSTANGRGQTFAPTDPEPDREAQIRRDREEAERLMRQEAEQQAEAAKQRRLKRLEEAKVETDIDGCWVLTFDSLGGPHKAVTNRLKQYLVSEAVSKLGKQPEELSIEQVQAGRADVPQQPNYCDCGLYLLHFVEHFLQNPDYMLNVVAATQTAAAKGGKKAQKDIQDAEEDRNLSWAFEEAQMRRARMRGEVKALVEQYAAGADERRQREEAIKEERRKRRQAEKERDEELQTRLAVERAEQIEAESARAAASTAALGGQAPAQRVTDETAAVSDAGLSSIVADLASPAQGLSVTDRSTTAFIEGSTSLAHDVVDSAVQLRDTAAVESGAGPPERLQLQVKGSATSSVSGLAIKGTAQSLRSPGADSDDLARDDLVGGDAPALAAAANDSKPLLNGEARSVEADALDAMRALAGDASYEASPASSGSASGHETGHLESDDEEVGELARRKTPMGRGASPPLRQSASTPAETPARNVSPELQQPPANQEQQQRETPRAGQKRTTRSSVATASQAASSQEAVVDEERPAKRLRGRGSAGSSKNVSRASSPVLNEEEQAPQSSTRSGTARTKRGGAGKGKRGRKQTAPAAPTAVLVISSDEDDEDDDDGGLT